MEGEQAIRVRPGTSTAWIKDELAAAMAIRLRKKVGHPKILKIFFFKTVLPGALKKKKTNDMFHRPKKIYLFFFFF